MNQQLAGYDVPPAFGRFDWCKFASQKTSSVTYIYLVTPAVKRLRGQSSVLYIGKTKGPIDKRYRQETKTKNTLRNSQATNIRLSFVIPALIQCNNRIDVFFTHGLTLSLAGCEVERFGEILQVWNKRHFLDHYKVNNGIVELPIEKFLSVHYAEAHLEVPPLNNAA